MSRLTIDSDVMENAKREMIGMIRASIDLDQLREVFNQQYSFTDADEISFKDGDTVVYNDDVVVKLNYKVGLTLEVMIDNEGNPIIPEKQESAEQAEDPVEEAGRLAGEAADDEASGEATHTW